MISVRGLRKVYRQGAREVVALDSVDLEIPDGTIHGVIGRSGSGKSTMVRCLTMLDQPTAGEIILNGQDMTSLSTSQLRHARRRIGVVFQHANLLSSRTVLDNVVMPLEITRISKAEARDKAKELISLVGLEGFENSYPAQLSGGQRQRVGIARALAADPDVLLCDEPTSALDPHTTDDILELIRTVAQRLGLTVIVITHEMSVVKSLCDSVSLLQSGHIVESGSLAEVASDLNSQLSRALLGFPAGTNVAVDNNSATLEVLSRGDTAEETVTSILERTHGIRATALAGTTERLGETLFAHYLIQVPVDSVPLETIRASLEAEGIQTREFTAESEVADELA